jgi:hypothetical protein
MDDAKFISSDHKNYDENNLDLSRHDILISTNNQQPIVLHTWVQKDNLLLNFFNAAISCGLCSSGLVCLSNISYERFGRLSLLISR